MKTRIAQALTSLAMLALESETTGAQGVSGAAIYGLVVSADSAPIPGAIVRVDNSVNGERWETRTGSAGRFFLENLSVGGPYRVAVRSLGFAPVERSGIYLSLGQRLSLVLSLRPAPVLLSAVDVRAVSQSESGADISGPTYIIKSADIDRLPLAGADRDFTLLALLSPQVTLSPNGGLSFGAQHDRLNALRIDGSTHQNLWGISSSGIGASGGLPPMAAEAVEEIQVLTAPFDVRYGNFAGGLVNAVTKSGSNTFHGSVFLYGENEQLTGKDSAGMRASEYGRGEVGFTLAGPIVRDRLAFFVNWGLTKAATPQTAPGVTSDTINGRDSLGTGVRYASAVRFREILRDTYGLDAGDFGRATIRVPTQTALLKLTSQLGVNNRLELSHNRADRSVLTGPEVREYGFYPFSSWFGTRLPRTSATRVNWRSVFQQRFTNELLVSYLAETNRCRAAAGYPVVMVLVDNAYIAAGTGPQCTDQFDRLSMWEASENLGLSLASHLVTVGAHARLAQASDLIQNFPLGFWYFDDLTAVQNGTPSEFYRDLPGAGRPEGPRGDFRVDEFAVYAQDSWSASPRLTATMGIRAEVARLPRPPVHNPQLLSALGANTAVTPSGRFSWSPRVNATYDLSGRQTSFVRAGAGAFSGPPAFFWFEQIYTNTGLDRNNLACFGADVPAFTLDPTNQPTTCGSGSGGVPDVVAFFDKSFLFPKNLKAYLGFDRRLPRDVTASVDLLLTRGLRQFEEREMNLQPPTSASGGEGGRVLYGTIDPSGLAAPNRQSQEFRSVLKITNGSGDYAYSLSGQLRKTLPSNGEVSAAYTYTLARDRLAAVADLAVSNIARTPVDGSLDNRNLTTSYWSVPHKITALATTTLSRGVQLSLVYIGFSGRPFSYVVAGDANADGMPTSPFDSRRNDLVYVPRDSADINLASPTEFERLNAYIGGEPCLRKQRGQILRRNSCREPWVNQTSARIAKPLRLSTKHTVEVGAELFNLLNVLNRDWGIVRETGQFDLFGNVPLVELSGYDSARERGIYTIAVPSRKHIVTETSRWRMRLSARYGF